MLKYVYQLFLVGCLSSTLFLSANQPDRTYHQGEGFDQRSFDQRSFEQSSSETYYAPSASTSSTQSNTQNCGCTAPCHCGCAEGHECTCPHPRS